MARRLRLDLRQFWDVAGRGGNSVDQDPDHNVNWWISGDPPQVLLGIDAITDAVITATPRGRWERHRLVYEPRDPVAVVAELLDGLRAGLDTAAQARRRSFRWCRYCGSLTSPEYRDAQATCMDCSEVVPGAVH